MICEDVHLNLTRAVDEVLRLRDQNKVLLEALENLECAVICCGGLHWEHSTLKAARAAIALARGEDK